MVDLAVLVVAGGVVQRRSGVAVHAVGVVVAGLCLDVVVADLNVLGGVERQTYISNITMFIFSLAYRILCCPKMPGQRLRD